MGWCDNPSSLTWAQCRGDPIEYRQRVLKLPTIMRSSPARPAHRRSRLDIAANPKADPSASCRLL